MRLVCPRFFISIPAAGCLLQRARRNYKQPLQWYALAASQPPCLGPQVVPSENYSLYTFPPLLCSSERATSYFFYFLPARPSSPERVHCSFTMSLVIISQESGARCVHGWHSHYGPLRCMQPSTGGRIRKQHRSNLRSSECWEDENYKFLAK